MLYIASFKKIVEYNLRSKVITNSISAHSSNVSAMLEIPESNLVITGGYDGMLNVWEFMNWKKRKEWLWGGWIYSILNAKVY